MNDKQQTNKQEKETICGTQSGSKRHFAGVFVTAVSKVINISTENGTVIIAMKPGDIITVGAGETGLDILAHTHLETTIIEGWLKQHLNANK